MYPLLSIHPPAFICIHTYRHTVRLTSWSASKRTQLNYRIIDVARWAHHTYIYSICALSNNNNNNVIANNNNSSTTKNVVSTAVNNIQSGLLKIYLYLYICASIIVFVIALYLLSSFVEVTNTSANTYLSVPPP